jgi:hypothetical protein
MKSKGCGMAAYGIFILGGWAGFMLALLFVGISRNISDRAISFIQPITQGLDSPSKLTPPLQITNELR